MGERERGMEWGMRRKGKMGRMKAMLMVGRDSGRGG